MCTCNPAAASAPCSAQRAGTQRAGTQKVQRSAAPAPKRSAGTQRVGTQRTAGRPQPAKQPARQPAKPAPKPRKERDSSTADQSYFNVTGYPFPLGPFSRRATIRKDIVRGTIWGFEQPQSLGGSNVTTNVRMTIVRLQSGGLWVHAPIAPTREWVWGRLKGCWGPQQGCLLLLSQQLPALWHRGQLLMLLLQHAVINTSDGQLQLEVTTFPASCSRCRPRPPTCCRRVRAHGAAAGGGDGGEGQVHCAAHLWLRTQGGEPHGVAACGILGGNHAGRDAVH